MLSDPLKLIPVAICIVAGVGLFTGKMDMTQVMGLLVAAGVIHPAISAINNVNTPK